MQKRFFKSVVATFALVAILGVTPVASVLVKADEHGVSPATACLHKGIVPTILDHGWAPLGGDQHVYTIEHFYWCKCGESWSEYFYEYGTHTYQFDYSSNQWVCTVCGDSYSN